MIKQHTFTYPFEGKDWASKFLIGCLFYLASSSITPLIPMLFPLGYGLRIMKRVTAGYEARMPAWDDWGDLATKGLAYFGITLLYLAPALIMAAGASILMGMGFILFVGSAGADEPNLALMNVGWMLIMLAVAVFFVCALLALVCSLPVPIATAHYVATGRFGAAFRLREVTAIIRANPEGFVVAWALTLGVELGAGLLIVALYFTLVFCVLLPVVVPVASFYTHLVWVNLFGQVYRQGRAALEEGEQKPAEPQTEAAAPAAPRPQTPIEELGLPARVEGCLKAAGLATVGQVLDTLERGQGELLAIKGFGPKALETLLARLRAQGFLAG